MAATIKILSLLTLFLLRTSFTKSMTINKISTGHWGSIGTLGGIRLAVDGSGFGTPFDRPRVEIGSSPKVADCIVVPYLSTSTTLICDTTKSTTHVDASKERMFGPLGRRSYHELVVKTLSEKADCLVTYAGGLCSVLLNNERTPIVNQLQDLSLRSITAGDVLMFRGDNLDHHDDNSNVQVMIDNYICSNVDSSGALLAETDFHSGKCLVRGHPLGPRNITINVKTNNNGLAQPSGNAMTEHPASGELFEVDVAPTIMSITPNVGSIHGGTKITLKGTSFGTNLMEVEVMLGNKVPCAVIQQTPDEIICRVSVRNSTLETDANDHVIVTAGQPQLFKGNRGSTFDVFESLDGGSAVESLKTHVNYPNSPTSRTVLRGFSNYDLESGLDNYGGKIYGWIVIPKTANYTFAFRSDDGGELFVSPNSNPSEAVSLFETTSYSSTWQEFPSSRRELQQGDEIYVELLYKEGYGGDFGEIGIR